MKNLQLNVAEIDTCSQFQQHFTPHFTRSFNDYRHLLKKSKILTVCIKVVFQTKKLVIK